MFHDAPIGSVKAVAETYKPAALKKDYETGQTPFHIGIREIITGK